MKSKESGQALASIETPFYLYDINLLDLTLKTATEAAKPYGYKIHYAIKANYDPRALSMIASYGLGIDCVSGNEVQLAIESGFDPKKIVFAGVGKKDSEIKYAIERGLLAINCESLQEMEVVNSMAGELGKKVDVAIRVNPDVDPMTNKCINTGQADCKFGISYEEVLENAEKILSMGNLNVRGMHLHIGSQIRNFQVFETLCDKVNVIVDNFVEKGFKLDFIDVGGGLGVDYDCPENEPVPDFARLFSIVNKHLKADGREVHFEFGRSIIAQSAELITRVLFTKTTATGRKLVIVDASMTELIRPMLYGAHHDIENVTPHSDEKETYTVVGTACESTDVLAKDIELSLTQRGDILAIKTAGAYGQSMASRYNLHELPRSVYCDEL